MDSLIAAAARALAAGDSLAALKRVALRDDPPALALRGIALAQLGDLARARELLRSAARAFGPSEATARARCIVAQAEIALVLRDLGPATRMLGAASAVLEAHGDRVNAAHAGYLEARRLLLIGELDEAERRLESVNIAALPRASVVGYWLVVTGIAIRRVRSEAARAALESARDTAREVGIPALMAEVERASRTLAMPAAQLITRDVAQVLSLAEVQALLASETLLIDARRNVVRTGPVTVPLAGRPVLFALARALAEAWPDDTPRETLLARAFGAREADESHRARLRVEIGRLRKLIAPLAEVRASRRGFVLQPHGEHGAVVLAPPQEEAHGDVLALLADGETWSSSALALALGVSARTVQRALEDLAAAGKAESVGRGRARRWRAPSVPGFPTSLLLPAPPAVG